MASFTVVSPDPFTFSNPSEWPNWKKRFQRFRAASGLDGKDETVQIDTLVYLMGEHADLIFTSFQLSDADSKKYDTVMKSFDDHFVVKKNVIYERAKFNSRIQTQGESICSFIEDLHKLADTCDYGNLREELIRDRIVVGVSNRRLSEKLQLEAKLTLLSATTTARQHEAVKKQQDEIHNQGLGQSVSRVENNSNLNSRKGQYDKYKSQQQSSQSKSNGKSSDKSTGKCFWCGSNKIHKKHECPAKDAKCNKCSKTGHFAKACKSSEVQEVYESELETDSVYVGAVTGNSAAGQRWITEVLVGGIPISFKLDPGADVTVLPYSLYVKKLKKRFPRLEEPNKRLNGPDGHKLNTVGTVTTNIEKDSSKMKSTVYIVKGLDRALLGVRECEELNLVKRLNEVSSGASKVNPVSEFPGIFKGLGKTDKPYNIKLEPNAKPYAVYTPRRVPLPLLDKLKEKLDIMVKMGVIVAVDEPTDWCAPLVIRPKPNNDIRICVDLTKLNKSVHRERHIMPALESSLGKLKGAKYFSKMDTTSGFWQVPLTEESKKYTTFITPFGRFQFTRLPFGITSAPEHFQLRMSKLLKDIDGVVVHSDDILVFAPTIEAHDQILKEVLKRLSEAHITLNEKKCEWGVTKIKYLGHILDDNGIHPDPVKLAAIIDMPKPMDVKGVRRFTGLVNYVGRFVPNLSHLAQPLYDLVKHDREFQWGPDQELSFSAIKKILTTEPVLAIFDANKKTILQADASSFGLGAALIQIDDKGHRKVISYASRTMTDTEKRYVQIEREALSFTWASERFKEFITGLNMTIETDHKPLVPIFTTKGLDELTPRLQRFRMRMMRFSFDIVHIPGKELFLADALSRSPISERTAEELEDDEEVFVNFVISSLPASASKLDEIRGLQQKDALITKVKKYILTEWPHQKLLSPAEKTFWLIRDELNEMDGILLRGFRIVIPPSLQKDMLERIHAGHFGITKCRARAKNSVWWPGLSVEIEQLVKNCVECTKAQPYRHEPLIPTVFPERPWQVIGMDLFKYGGSWYLVCQDYYSRYPEFAKLESLTSKATIRHVKSIFSRHGIPEIVRSDNGPQFEPTRTSEFQHFAREYGFQHITSSPKYAQSNGLAESAVKLLKRVLSKNQDPYKAVLEYRASPLSNGYSPAELLMGRKLRTTLPSAPGQLSPSPVPREHIRIHEEQRMENQKRNFDRRHGVHGKDIKSGDVVWVKDMKRWGTIGDKVAPRSFNINTQQGVLRRNSYHIQRTDRSVIPEEEVEPEVIPEEETTTNPYMVPLDIPSNRETKSTTTDTTTKTATKTAADTSSTFTRTRSGRTVKPVKRYGYN